MVVAALALAAAASQDPEEAEPEPELVGPLTRAEIEASLPEWVEQVVQASPDAAAAAELPEALHGAEVAVFFGTWCSDSRRELTRLWRALDEAGAIEPPEIRYVGVDRDKEQPAELLTGVDLQYVPTLVVRRDGRELGRIVETAPTGIELDLLALLRGEREGVVSARDDLEPARPSERP